MYSHLRTRSQCVTKQPHRAYYELTQEQEGVALRGCEGEGHEDALDSGARRGQAELHSPVVHQVELHIPARRIQNTSFHRIYSPTRSDINKTFNHDVPTETCLIFHQDINF